MQKNKDASFHLGTERENKNMQINYELYRYAMLDPVRDAKLAKDLKFYAAKAGIPPQFVYKPFAKFSKGLEKQYLENFRKLGEQGIFGLCFVKQDNLLNRLSAITGCMLRNYYNARLLTIQNVLQEDDLGDYDLLSVLNFHTKGAKGSLAMWEIPKLLSWLYERYTMQKQTVLTIYNWKSLQEDYGSDFVDFFQEFYSIIE